MFSKTTSAVLSLAFVALALGSPIDDFSKNVQTSLKDLQGVNCLVESVLNLDDVADEFSYVIKNNCGKAKDLKDEIAATKELMAIIKKIDTINSNEKVCNNAGYDADQDAETTPSKKCVNQLKTQMSALLTSFNNTKKVIVNGLKKSYSSDACVKMAMSNFRYFLNSYPARVEVCAQL